MLADGEEVSRYRWKSQGIQGKQRRQGEISTRQTDIVKYEMRRDMESSTLMCQLSIEPNTSSEVQPELGISKEKIERIASKYIEEAMATKRCINEVV